MTQETFRTALVFAISVVLVAGLYLGWHFTHQPEANPSCMWRGQRIHGSMCP